ncbi:hypothetical protein MM_0791 [Methanosarcina mazei Go1]|uniref:Uncharacterized protein n=1 Tax=Methanosarcina mazei (strain ATCC BAA-159 / DSM 3647 / Goe1 / Go1 / JCM 11833 / OCM 88) TaxID=192952 RepID=Q8PYR9_METMA|nr:hypothetical protein MM_0791 [Methanosarcina mazei Go1]
MLSSAYVLNSERRYANIRIQLTANARIEGSIHITSLHYQFLQLLLEPGQHKRRKMVLRTYVWPYIRVYIPYQEIN